MWMTLPRDRDQTLVPSRWQIEAIARRLEGAYALERAVYARFLGYPVPADPINWRFNRCWPRIARTVLELRCEPEEFMHAQWSGALRCPYPHRLDRKAAVGKYLSHVFSVERPLRCSHDRCRELRGQIAQICQTCESQEESRAAARRLIDSEAAEDPFTGYCLAEAVPDREYCERYLDAAACQYLRDRGVYDDVWEDGIPSRVRSVVDAYIRRIESDVRRAFG